MASAFARPTLAETLRETRAEVAAAAPRPGPATAAPAPADDPVRLVAPAGPGGLRGAARALRRRRTLRRPALHGAGGAVTTAGQLVYAVGDIHGRYDLLLELLARLAQDAGVHAAGRAPVLVLLGDYVDRGPDSARVVEALVALAQAPGWRLVALKGNHEQAMLRFIDQPHLGGPWLRFGGEATLSSYGVAPPGAETADLVRARDELLAAMPAAHLHALLSLPLAATVGDYAFVHAGVAPGVPLEDQQ
jgi:serine/threonine protein phosphatase 1